MTTGKRNDNELPSNVLAGSPTQEDVSGQFTITNKKVIWILAAALVWTASTSAYFLFNNNELAIIKLEKAVDELREAVFELRFQTLDCQTHISELKEEQRIHTEVARKHIRETETRMYGMEKDITNLDKSLQRCLRMLNSGQ